ncbi:hypothetical protein GQX73_g5905 [Xylaria multiplex]|uniref:Cyanovirin-N domain-containing protein n=1 Tax=Xylaria multiplex TaxID=323545 RepID=A0A7C8ITJ0_9PEZI|nr:hypothetical protein GQX73_g5905 [Xylaria multiplex]
MKASFASTLASLPFLAITLAFEVPWFSKLSLSQANCENLYLEDGHILHVTCTNPIWDPKTTPPEDLTVNLNDCIANYMGTLNFAYNGGFASSCESCKMDVKKLVCECSAGEGLGTKHTEFDLDNWRVIRLRAPVLQISCGGSEGLEKRVDDKNALPFIA